MNLDGGRGNIGPHYYSNHRQLHRELVGGQWLTPSATQIPDTCIDGRPPEQDDEAPSCRTAGATLGLWISAVLAGRPREPLPDVESFVLHLASNSLPVGTHGGPDPSAIQCGCGAADGLAAILANLLDHRDDVRALLPAFRAEQNLLDYAFILRCKQLLLNINMQGLGYGSRMVHFTASQPRAKFAKLQGEHEESLVLINHRAGTTVNSPALRRAYNPKPQIFAVDAWAFAPASSVICAAVNGLEAPRVVAAQAAFNAASLITLCSSALPLIQVE